MYVCLQNYIGRLSDREQDAVDLVKPEMKLNLEKVVRQEEGSPAADLVELPEIDFHLDPPVLARSPVVERSNSTF